MSTQQGADMTDTKNDPHAELMRLADEHASIKFVEGIDGNEALVDKAYEALEVYAVALTGRLTQAEQEITAYDLTMDRQTARIAELEKSYSDACKLVADMHLAAVGEVKGPKRGVVEDVADLRAERDDLRAQLETVGAGGVSMMTRTLTDRLERAERMFGAACADLGAINQALGLDPDDGGAEPIIDAIKEMQSCVGAGGVSALARPLEVAASVTDAEILEACGDFARDAIGKTNLIRIGRQLIAFAASRAPVALPAEPTDHDQLDAMALDRYKVVATTGGFWPFAVVAGDGTAYLYIGQRKTCEQVARRLAGAFLDGAFTATHPAQAEQPAPAVVCQKDAK